MRNYCNYWFQAFSFIPQLWKSWDTFSNYETASYSSATEGACVKQLVPAATPSSWNPAATNFHHLMLWNTLWMLSHVKGIASSSLRKTDLATSHRMKYIKIKIGATLPLIRETWHSWRSQDLQNPNPKSSTALASHTTMFLKRRESISMFTLYFVFKT